MSENENQAMNWTTGLIGSLVLHVVVVGLFVSLGGSDPASESESDDPPSAVETPATPTPPTNPTTPTATPPAATPVTHQPPRAEPVRRPPATPATTRTETPAATPGDKVYVVQRGDNASKIAQKHNLSLQELAILNGTTVKKLNGIVVGQKLKVAE